MLIWRSYSISGYPTRLPERFNWYCKGSGPRERLLTPPSAPLALTVWKADACSV
jgi:hypothetical protein